MKISYSWIKELVDVRLNPQVLADKLSMAGLSVELLENTGDDWVYHIEVTSNRPDWLSVRGIVQEIAAITDSKLKPLKIPVNRKPIKAGREKKCKTSPLKQAAICIKDINDCGFYCGSIISGVRVSPSPDWLAKRLQSLGMRPVNNVVDAINYCMLETGQPMHAFDFDRVANSSIIVRRAKKGEEISLLDGTKRTLDGGILVIADESKPIAVAGIMGGAETEVGENTKNIFIESAYFNPIVVRRGSRSLGVASDSSYRFERGVDVSTVKKALDRAVNMIQELAGGELASSNQAGRIPVQAMRKINFCFSDALELLGMEMTIGQARNIFLKLGFSLGKRIKEDCFMVSVPVVRRDIKIQEDLIEELVRVWGYDKIPLTAPAIRPFDLNVAPIQSLEARVKDVLVKMGLKEVITYSLAGEDDFKKVGLEPENGFLELENPLTKDYRFLRPSLVPSLLNCVSYNINHGNKNFEIFETGHNFSSKDGKNITEGLSLCMVLCGDRQNSWYGESKRYTLFDLKGMIAALFDELQIKHYDSRKSVEIPFAAFGTGCQMVSGESVLASFCKVKEDVKKALGVKSKEDIFVAELNLNLLATKIDLKRNFIPIVSIPSVVRDVSVLADESASYGRIKALIEIKAAGFLRNISLAGIYQGKEIPKGQLGLTITIEYGSDQKTLTDEEVNSVHKQVLDSLISELSVKIR